MKNAVHYPAKNINVIIFTLPAGYVKSQAIDLTHEICARAEAVPASERYPGSTLLSGGSQTTYTIINVGHEMLSVAADAGLKAIEFAGCVDYTFGPGDRTRGKTGFRYILTRITKKSSSPSYFTSGMPNLESSKLRLSRALPVRRYREVTMFNA